MSEQKLLGDMTETLLKQIGADKLAKFYERKTGRPCNCAGRKQTLNNIHRAVQRAISPRDRTLPIIEPTHKLPTHPVDEAPIK